MEGSKRVVIDTNLLVRYLVDDDQKKAEAVERLLDKAFRGELRIHIPSIVVAELVWVLESFYHMEAERVAELVDAILNTSGVDVSEKSRISSALKIYRARNIDLIDAWIIEFAKEKSIKTIYTFDKKHFRDIEEIETRAP